MATYSLYDTCILKWSAALTALDGILTKAEVHAKENGIDADAQYINARIYDDMQPLPFQIDIVTIAMKMPLDLLAGNAPEWSGRMGSCDDLKTFADLHARVKSAQDYIDGVKPEDVDGREEEILKSPGPLASSYPDGLSAKAFCDSFITPNVYFHLVTAYDILRQEGVPLGKNDYLTAFLPVRT